MWDRQLKYEAGRAPRPRWAFNEAVKAFCIVNAAERWPTAKLSSDSSRVSSHPPAQPHSHTVSCASARTTSATLELCEERVFDAIVVAVRETRQKTCEISGERLTVSSAELPLCYER